MLTIFIIAITTPQFLISLIEWAKKRSGVQSSILAYMTAAIQNVIRIIITYIFNWSIKYIGFWRQLQINRNILIFSTLYLLMVLLLLPTFGFSHVWYIKEFFHHFILHHMRLSDEDVRQWMW